MRLPKTSSTFFMMTCMGLMLLLGACKPKQTEIVIVPDVQKNHLQRNHILGAVKQMVSYTLLANPDALQSDSLASDSLSFDTVSVFIQNYSPDGYLLSAIKLTPEGDTMSVKTISYLSDARQDRWTEMDYTEHTTVCCRYEYDMNDFLSAEKLYYGDSLLMSVSYKTDGAGNVVEMVRNYVTYSIKNTSAYNEHGLVSRIEEYDPSGKMYKYVTIEYDNYGDEVNRRAFKGANDLIEYTYTEYNQDGSLKKVLFEDRLHNSKEHYDYSAYDAQGNWTVETRTKDKQMIYKRTRTYIYY